MSKNYGAYITIPRYGGRIELKPDKSVFYIGRDTLKDSITKPLEDPRSLDAISSIRTDNSGQIIKQQFVISYKNGQYYIEDKNSSNGTYLGTKDLKKTGIQNINHGDSIVLGIQVSGKLIQLKLYFYIAKSANELSPSTLSQEPLYSPQFDENQTEDKPDDNGHYDGEQTKGEFMEIPNSSYGAIALPNPPNAQLNTLDSSNSLIYTEKKTFHKDPFSKDSDFDLSWVYNIEDDEKKHILYAFGLLFAVIYHFQLNVNLIMLITSPFDPVWFFLGPMPIALIFCISFVIHELAHLNMGKHLGYTSRFCLTKVGVEKTKKAAIWGLPFGLPGAAVSVGINPETDQDNIGKIKVAGPLSNLIFGLILMIIAALIPSKEIAYFICQGASLNFFLGLFNLMPLKVKGFALDGENIIKWNQILYFVLLTLFVIGLAASLMYSNVLFQEAF